MSKPKTIVDRLNANKLDSVWRNADFVIEAKQEFICSNRETGEVLGRGDSAIAAALDADTNRCAKVESWSQVQA